jgi:hypothetical protein
MNWGAFEQLPGAANYNFEMLCRALIRRHYGRYGDFVALAQQPGVEFHLKLHTSCALGDPGRWYGWQCRWYELPSGRALGKGRQAKIAQAITTTEKELPELTDWVLWTRRPLTKGDQKWFYTLKTHMRLHLWTAAEVEEHLSGPAEILRGTYFGELVLTPDALADLHESAVAPIRQRWQPEVHQTVDAERTLRRILGETETWDDLTAHAHQLEADAAAVDANLSDLAGSFADATAEVIEFAHRTAAVLMDAHTALDQGDLDLLRQQLANRPARPHPQLTVLPRQLRAARKRAGLTVTNALADARFASDILDEVDACLGVRLVGVLADAGCGKTQLAAQLTAAAGDRPAGILLQGKDLHAGHNLDDLARRVVIQGTPASSMEALVAAVDAAGQRARRRLPIVIDGLNEAEDTRDWKSALASLNEVLRQYPYVLVVCTVRPAFSSEALPVEVRQLEIPDFGHDIFKAVRRYFAHYRIDVADADLPLELLRHPLILRLFCEVTNFKRERVVGVEATPGSLTALFDRYLEQAAARIMELAPRTQRYYVPEVRAALHEVGAALWEENARSLDRAALRRRLSDDIRPWDKSLVRALEQEGILLRIPGDTADGDHVTVVYDALAGHIVADTFLRHGPSGLEERLKDYAFVRALNGPLPDQHPLATDTFRALVGLVPRRLYGQQLWTLLDEPMRTSALRGAADLEGAHLDAATVDELATLTAQPLTDSRNMLVRLSHTRGVPSHPLNAAFLDTVLRPMSVADRDLRWTEWVRRYHDELLGDLQHLENRWRTNTTKRSPSDCLRARWIMWTLTSTVRRLRDQATRTLYWFGRGEPGVLFDLTLDALSINDPYVPERLLAAAYGVAMAHQYDFEDHSFVQTELPRWGRELYEAMFASEAPVGTTHILARDYARHIIDIAVSHHPHLLADEERSRTIPPFEEGGIREWGESEDRDKGAYSDGSAPLHMDFENYTLGRLVNNRRNYDFEHEEFQQVLANIFWRIYDLGYSLKAFGEVDKILNRQNWSYGRSENDGKTDRYGKKYSWIAYFELAGLREDQGLARDRYEEDPRIPDIDIDPSFPADLKLHELVREDFLGDRHVPVEEWIVHGDPPDLSDYFVVDELCGEAGPWILLDGYINQEDAEAKRRCFAFQRGLIVRAEEAAHITRTLEQGRSGRWLPAIPDDHYTFAGEIPWCDAYSYNDSDELEVVTGTKIISEPIEELVLLRNGERVSDEEKTSFMNGVAEHIVNGDEVAIEAALREQGLEWKIERSEVEREVSECQFFEILVPVRNNAWEDYHSAIIPGRNVSTPAKQITEHLDLVNQPQTFDLYEDDGRLASMTFHYGEPLGAFQSFVYIRNDLLDQFLSDTGARMIYVVSGRREFYSGDFGERESFAETHNLYERFEHTQLYKPS